MARSPLPLLALTIALPACDGDGTPPDAVAATAAATATARLRAAPPAPPAAPTPSSTAAADPTPKRQRPAAPQAEPRVYAKTRHVWIRGFPDGSTQWIGYLSLGDAVRIRDAKPVYGPGCNDRWVPVEPRGWICVSGDGVTTNPDDRTLVALRRFAPLLTSDAPHSYRESLGAALYATLPDESAQRAREADLASHLERLAQRAGGPAALSLEVAATPPPELPQLPRRLQTHRVHLMKDSAFAYVHRTHHAGRAWLLTADFKWIAADRTVEYEPIDFAGVALGDEAHLPLAFFRRAGRPRFRRADDGTLAEGSGTFARHSWVQLTDARVEQGGEIFIETSTPGEYVRASDAIIPDPSPTTPWGARVGFEDETEHRPKGRQTWIEVSVLGRWLVAYEGTRPVFATLVSPGRGGVPVPGKDPVSTASTPTGRFKITGKFATATMEAPHGLIHSDVPWTQNFSGPHALHSAYWHNDWGDLKSGGCINVSPKDGKWLYSFTEPAVPTDWHAVRWDTQHEPSTSLIVHR